MSSLVRRIQIKLFKQRGYKPRGFHYEQEDGSFRTSVRWPRYYPKGQTEVRDVIIRRG